MIIIGITNRNLSENFYGQISKISKSKLDYLIIREKDLKENELLNLSLQIKERLKTTNIKIIVNSNMNIAKIIDADGIQLSFKDFTQIKNNLSTKIEKDINKDVNKLEEKGDIYNKVGVSIHSFEEGKIAYELGASYVIYGHVFETDCKKGVDPRGVDEIEALSKVINIPIIGLGGINQKNFEKVINAGASGIAIMSSLMKSNNPKELIENYL